MTPNSTVDLVEAAARLRVPWHTAHRLVLTGKLKGWRDGGWWYVDPGDLGRLLEERNVEDKEDK